MTREEQVALVESMFLKSEEEVNEMFNEIVKGFTAMLLSEGGLDDEAVKRKMRNMDSLFDEVTSAEARRFYERLYQ